MLTSPTGKGVIAMGGFTDFAGTISKAMFELNKSLEWTRLEQTLKIDHFGCLVAIPITDELVYEKNESKVNNCAIL